MSTKNSVSSKQKVSLNEEKIDTKDDEIYKPSNEYVNVLLTDLYQITMAYAYFINKTYDNIAVFDLFFRKCPFNGEYCIFAGLDECLRYINSFKFTTKMLEQLQKRFPQWDKKFWSYLGGLDCSKIKVYAQREGSVVFPRTPLLRIEGPLIVGQLLETTLLNLVNYASLVATNAARIRHAVGSDITLLEFGLRRAQGSDGAMSASRYAYIGGFNGTSNVEAGLTFNIPIKGTHAHSFVSSFNDIKSINKDVIKSLQHSDGQTVVNGDFVDNVLKWRAKVGNGPKTNEGELAAFIAYAYAFPSGFLALIDTYSTLESGAINFMIVSLCLYMDYGYKPIGIRLDSGDLAYLSKQVRAYFNECSKKFNVPFEKLIIVASNDINEEILYSLKDQKHEINSFGIGTHLVTCKRQPALGCVYKLVAIDGKPKIKLSESITKMSIPGKKQLYRLFSKTNEAILDIMTLEDDNRDNNYVKKNTSILCEHPFEFTKRCIVNPTRIEKLLIKVWDNKLCYKSPDIPNIKLFRQNQVGYLREDYKRHVNPTPYKVSVSSNLKHIISKLWKDNTPVQTFD